MKKIAIITLYENNFGSILQAYATYSYLESLGNKCTILKFDFTKSRFQKLVSLPLIIVKCICYKEFFKDKINLKCIMKREMGLLSHDTREKMDEFVKEIFTIQHCSYNDLKNLNDRFDLFIAGSDQIWKGYNRFSYLTFAEKTKRVALAPSFGTLKLKEYNKKAVTRALKGFEILSVREESGKDIIRELTGKEAERLPDPTILFDRQEWMRFAKNGIRKSHYILIHFLNEPDDIAVNAINDYLLSHDCEAVCICNAYEKYDKLIRYCFMDINPYDYVSLLNYADFVFTDSFHSTLFALNLETQFLVFERQYFYTNTQKTRIDDLLKRVGMQERFITGSCPTDIAILKRWSSEELFAGERRKMKLYIEREVSRNE